MLRLRLRRKKAYDIAMQILKAYDPLEGRRPSDDGAFIGEITVFGQAYSFSETDQRAPEKLIVGNSP